MLKQLVVIGNRLERKTLINVKEFNRDFLNEDLNGTYFINQKI